MICAVLSVLIRLFLFLLGWTATGSSIIDSNVVGSCCTHMENPHSLMNCIITHTTASKAIESSLRIVGYYTDNIIPYSAYAFATNAAFSLPEIPMSILNPQTLSSSFLSYYSTEAGNDTVYTEIFEEEPDVRWNKIKILIHLLKVAREEEGSTKRSRMWYLWIDSDLILLNGSFLRSEVHELISRAQLSNRHLIVSRDSRPESGIMNTGMMLIDDSDWSMEFLYAWWNAYNRSIFSDQAAFTFLWRLDDSEHSYKLAENTLLLSSYEMNSIFPAYIYQEVNHSVLHLAGESDLYREIVFKTAFNETCSSLGRMYSTETGEKYGDNMFVNITKATTSATSKCEVLPNQLGLTRNRLRDIRIDLASKMFNFLSLVKHEKFSTCHRVDFLGRRILINDSTNTHQDTNYDLLRSMAQEALQLGYAQGNEDRGKLLEELEVAVEMMEWFHVLAMKSTHTQVQMLFSADKTPSADRKNALLYAIQVSIETAFEYIEVIGSYLSQHDTLSSLLEEEEIYHSAQKKEKLIEDRYDLLNNRITTLVEILEDLSSNPKSYIRRTASYYSYKIKEFQAIVTGADNMTSLLAVVDAWEILENNAREDVDHSIDIRSDHAGEAAMIYFQLFEAMTTENETLENDPMKFLCGIIAGDESLRIFGLRWSMSQGLGRSIHSGVFDDQVYETSAATQGLVAPMYILEIINERIGKILHKVEILEKIMRAQPGRVMHYDSIEEMEKELKLKKCVIFFSERNHWFYDDKYFIDISRKVKNKFASVSMSVNNPPI